MKSYERIVPEPTDLLGIEWRYRFLIALGLKKEEAWELAKLFAGVKS